MARTPKLSICIPSRNRQIYFQSVIQALLRSRRTDVEFVLADNSDDPAIMNGFIQGLSDPRIRYLPSQDKALSMLDNWERTVAAATGDWVTVIGDDDHIDPEAACLIERVEQSASDIDVIGWTVLHYSWPDGQPARDNLFVPFGNKIFRMPREILLGRIFAWNDATGAVPASGMTIYHHLVSRRLLDIIKTTYGRYFENPVVDYDSALKCIVHGRGFLASQRPFSVMGACPESNTYSVSRLSDMRRKLATFVAELEGHDNPDTATEAFPFRMEYGVTSTIGQVVDWYKTKYNFSYDGWEPNFIKACARNAELFLEREDFEIVRDTYQRVIDTWHGGRYRGHFNPVFQGDVKTLRVTGFSQEGAYIDSGTAGIATPAAFYDFACEMMLSASEIEGDNFFLPLMPDAQAA